MPTPHISQGRTWVMDGRPSGAGSPRIRIGQLLGCMRSQIPVATLTSHFITPGGKPAICPMSLLTQRISRAIFLSPVNFTPSTATRTYLLIPHHILPRRLVIPPQSVELRLRRKMNGHQYFHE